METKKPNNTKANVIALLQQLEDNARGTAEAIAATGDQAFEQNYIGMAQGFYEARLLFENKTFFEGVWEIFNKEEQ